MSAAAALPPFTVSVTADAYRRWLVGRDGALPADRFREGMPIPASYLFFLRGQPALGVSSYRLLGRDPDRGLFGGIRYEVVVPARLGDLLTATGEVIERRTAPSPRGGDLTLTRLRTVWRRDGGAHIVETVQMVDLPPGPPSDPVPGPAPSPDMKVIATIAPASRVQVAWMTVATGDLNPLHVDRSYATGRRFADVVLPGTLLVAVVERELTRVVGAMPSAIEARMRAPSYPDEALELRGVDDGADWRFQLVGAGHVRMEGAARVPDHRGAAA